MPLLFWFWACSSTLNIAVKPYVKRNFIFRSHSGFVVINWKEHQCGPKHTSLNLCGSSPQTFVFRAWFCKTRQEISSSALLLLSCLLSITFYYWLSAFQKRVNLFFILPATHITQTPNTLQSFIFVYIVYLGHSCCRPLECLSQSGTNRTWRHVSDSSRQFFTFSCTSFRSF